VAHGSLTAWLRPGLILLTLGFLAACDGGPLEPEPEPEPVPVRVVTFGDSNLNNGYAGSDPTIHARSYISSPLEMALHPDSGNSPLQVAGKIESRWEALRDNPITAINHSIGATTTGGGGHGGSDRTGGGAPNARTRVDGVTRFEGEVLGLGAPWNGGEPVNQFYPTGPITRSNAFTPGPNDFAFVSLGTNDPSSGLSVTQTLDNLGWMVEQWLAAGLAANQLMIGTLPPLDRPGGELIPSINDGIRALQSLGIHLIDLAEHTSADNGASWRDEALHVGDGVHYSESVREWLADQVVEHMRLVVPG
jgi:hypothetical protein